MEQFDDPDDDFRPRHCVIDGQVVYVDPVAVAVMRGFQKLKCRRWLTHHASNIMNLKRKIAKLDPTSPVAAILIFNADDEHGSEIAEMLMPGHDWDAERDADRVAAGCTVVERDSLDEALMAIDEEAALKLRLAKGLPIVIVDYGVAAVFEA